MLLLKHSIHLFGSYVQLSQVELENVEAPGVLHLLDITGKIILEKDFDPSYGSTLEVDISSLQLAAGSYLVRWTGGDKAFLRWIVVE